MWRLSLFLGLALCWSPVLMGGQVYGTLLENGKGVAGVDIEILPQGKDAKDAYKATTGPDGSYRIFVTETGKCAFRASKGEKSAPATNVFSYATPVKYDFDLLTVNGQYALKGK